MAVTSIRIRRRTSGATGAPASLKTAEIAYNMMDDVLYVGKGDDGSGNATSVVAFAKADFTQNVPSGGSEGDLLTRGAAGALTWSPAPEGSVYSASGNGIELSGSQFQLNFTEIATGISLSDYATTSALTTGLAGKANTSHTHDAADVTSGVFDIARIPVLPSSVQIVSSGGIAALTAPQQAEIGDGSIVTTTDGRRWVYSGSGSKTAEASYIELADISPDWSVIANKPSFHAVATSGDYDDLTDKPTLGTMAAQNASAVAITGGTIDGVTIDGGTF